MVDNRFAELLGTKKAKISYVSRATGISRGTLTNLYYSKSTAISFDEIEKLCDYFSCQVGDLITYKSINQSKR